MCTLTGCSGCCCSTTAALARLQCTATLMSTLTVCFPAYALLLQIPGAEVTVYRVKDPVRGDDPGEFDDGVLESPVITEKVSWEGLTAGVTSHH